MFTTLFLGCVLAVFLTLGAVRGDAERGLLAAAGGPAAGPDARCWAGASPPRPASAALYVAAVYAAAMVITGVAGGWWPDDPVGPGRWRWWRA